MQYTNPVKHLEIDNWPYGSQCTHAVFSIESGKKGERAVRSTINPKTGQPNKPKKTTFSKLARIVTGEDGKTYVVEWSQYGFFSVMQSNLQFQEETIHPGDPKFDAMVALFTEV